VLLLFLFLFRGVAEFCGVAPRLNFALSVGRNLKPAGPSSGLKAPHPTVFQDHFIPTINLSRAGLWHSRLVLERGLCGIDATSSRADQTMAASFPHRNKDLAGESDRTIRS
jgi:hypothetical protein